MARVIWKFLNVTKLQCYNVTFILFVKQRQLRGKNLVVRKKMLTFARH